MSKCFYCGGNFNEFPRNYDSLELQDGSLAEVHEYCLYLVHPERKK